MGARIMVVEDEEALTELLRYNLEGDGYDVETVMRGDDADTRHPCLARANDCRADALFPDQSRGGLS